MTLKERFEQFTEQKSYDKKNYNAEECEQIADDYAIEFAEWTSFYRDKNRNVHGNMLHAKSKYDDTYTTKELLEIFKREKKL
jgi:hypothetical protein